MNTKQVAEWLREAALIADYAVMINSLKPADRPVKKSVFHERAAQVEAMACDKCKWFILSVWDINFNKKISLCENIDITVIIQNQDPKFGCIHWEEKK